MIDFVAWIRLNWGRSGIVKFGSKCVSRVFHKQFQWCVKAASRMVLACLKGVKGFKCKFKDVFRVVYYGSKVLLDNGWDYETSFLWFFITVHYCNKPCSISLRHCNFIYNLLKVVFIKHLEFLILWLNFVLTAYCQAQFQLASPVPVELRLALQGFQWRSFPPCEVSPPPY